MKAIVYRHYGPLEALTVSELPRPNPQRHEVLVHVRAAALHIGDVFAVRGSPLPVRLSSGLVRPSYGVPGCDLAGLVLATGSGVKRLRPGDAVFGACEGGTCAEYACVAGDRLARKPAQLSFEEAAALPTSGVAALHALRDVAQVRAGQRVLINGAAGGVGSYALQLAKAYGAHVTAVCSGANASYVRALGADRVIDYTTEDFTHGEQRYDVILDNVENRSLTECRRALAERGTLVLNSGTGVTGLAMAVRLLAPVVLSPFTRQNLRRYLSMPKHDDLVAISDLVTSGAVKPVIEQVCTLEETAAALAKIEGGHVRGKIVVRV